MEIQFPIKHKFFKGAGFRFILAKTRFPVEKHEDESGRQQRVKLPITVATRVKLPRSQSSANEIENLPEVCQTFCPLEQKFQQACETCQTCRFRNLGVNPRGKSLIFFRTPSLKSQKNHIQKSQNHSKITYKSIKNHKSSKDY